MVMAACNAVALCRNHGSQARGSLVSQCCVGDHTPGVYDAIEDVSVGGRLAENTSGVLLNATSETQRFGLHVPLYPIPISETERMNRVLGYMFPLH